MTNAVNLTKLNTYAVELETEKISLVKLNTYAVELFDYDGFYQDLDADRPVYRDAPSGGVPYIDMSATGASLKVNVSVAARYRFIVYKADQTFEEFDQDLVAGANVINYSDDFNQIVMLKWEGVAPHRFTRDAIKEGMKARV